MVGDEKNVIYKHSMTSPLVVVVSLATKRK
jgi:hypothetical protein